MTQLTLFDHQNITGIHCEVPVAPMAVGRIEFGPVPAPVLVHPTIKPARKSTKAGQCAAILAYLREGNSLTPMDALEWFGCFRLAARVSDLRKQGHNITSEIVDVGEGKRVARYHL